MPKYEITSFFLISIILLWIGSSYPAFPKPPPTPPSPLLEVKAGEILFVRVQLEEPDAIVEATFRNRTIPFFKTTTIGEYGALLGIDLADAPSQEEVAVHVQDNPERALIQHYRISVLKNKFGVQELTLPKESVDLDEKTLKRVKAEQRRMIESMSVVTSKQLWKGQFIMPVEGNTAGTFGRRRVINGQPRNPHTGEDIYAPMGTKVAASNSGIVELTGDFFFSGKSIIIDHGLGLFTMYFHLSEVLVNNREHVPKGKIIGLVGATGRVTGPHLHWGVRLNEARVNPLSLMKLPLGMPGTD